ncbi:MAG: PAS domain-containing protein [Planctomycetes bacterium]|nr:PAS domain-containing protein [Planctomycetota bacterium]
MEDDRALVDHAPDGLLLVGADGRIRRANAAAARLLGAAPGELVGLPLEELRGPGAPRPGRERWGRVELDVRRAGAPDGVAVLSLRPAADAEDELRRYERIVSATPDHISVVDRGYVYRTVNDAYLVAHGLRREEIVGQRVAALLGEEFFERVVRPRLDECLAGRTVSYTAWFDFPVERRFMSVTYYPLRDAAGQVQGVVVSSRNETELHRAQEELREKEEQLLHAQKLEAVGRLAGGVAHDFNNLLTVIMGYAEVLLRRAPRDPLEREMLEEIQAASERAGSLTAQLLTFSRKQLVQPRLLDLDAVVSDMHRLLRRVIGDDVVLETRHGAAGRVLADRGQLEQVLMNLAVNARDAMPGGGRLSIVTGAVTLDAAQAAALDLAAGPHVELSVTDTGEGMDEATRARIFEPFFTTKEQDKGTGLGLSTVYGIVRQAGGAVEVRSEPGAGATFRILLPASPAGADEAGAAAAGPAPRGTETVLLVEDDAHVRRLLEQVLATAGYDVLPAADAPQALDLSRGHAGRIHLLLTDLSMPRVGGRALARRLLGERPDMAVLLMSGHAEDDGGEGPVAGFVQKPVRLEVLLERVRESLKAR